MEAEKLIPPHPFPARMAPEIALRAVTETTCDGVVLDPMCGSGTVLKAAVLSGRPALGFDIDPLAVLMSRVWTSDIDVNLLAELGHEVLAEASRLDPKECSLPWIDGDPETRKFIEYWFASPQAAALRCLAYVLQRESGLVADAIRLAMSRLIVTKEHGASLARDVSHSRPHRVMDSNDFDVFGSFQASLMLMARRLSGRLNTGRSDVRLGDARILESVETESVAQVITSPPYLNAIDYLRGHKLALVWFGYTVGDLRQIRAGSIGAERGLDKVLRNAIGKNRVETITASAELPSNLYGIVNRYVRDTEQFISETWRVLAPGGETVLVIGNSTVRGVYIDNAKLLGLVAEGHGFRMTSKESRTLPHAKRYLPPPTSKELSALGSRMRSETILRLVKPRERWV